MNVQRDETTCFSNHNWTLHVNVDSIIFVSMWKPDLNNCTNFNSSRINHAFPTSSKFDVVMRPGSKNCDATPLVFTIVDHSQ